MYLPFKMESMRRRVLVGRGAINGPTTKDGFTTTRLMPKCSANLHASFSANVFAYAYHSCHLEMLKLIKGRPRVLCCVNDIHHIQIERIAVGCEVCRYAADTS